MEVRWGLLGDLGRDSLEPFHSFSLLQILTQNTNINTHTHTQQRYGASTLVLDHRIFVSFNPFSIYVTQADVKPGCVLRAANVVQALQGRGLLTEEEVQTCKNGSNTWAYVGDINDKPQLSCVYQSDDAQNEFLSNPKVGLGEDVYDD
jgi:hypothetical protein